tara:strand:+ start:95 stop:1186 length:1092 start_codon:yes stop_codon:yes gene_type:complete
MRIAVIGAGKSGCISAISAKHLSQIVSKDIEIQIYHDPSINIKNNSVGSCYETIKLLFKFHQDNLSFKDLEDDFDATLKTGILYKDWGKGGFNFHGDDGGTLIHFIPKKFSDYILSKKEFTVIEKNIYDPESEVDADVIIDCRGRDESIQYQSIINPINSSMSAYKDTEDIKDWSDHIARPHGWILGIPNKKSIYYEYFYNKKMSSKKDVISDFTEFLGIQPEKYQYINNYFADDIFVGERTIINGSRHYSLEPLESMSLQTYKDVSMKGLKHFFGIMTKKEVNKKIFDRIMKWESTLLWCYHSGSIYNTNFWNYAKNLDYRDIVKDKFINLLDKYVVPEIKGQGVERMSSNIFLDQWNKAGI